MEDEADDFVAASHTCKRKLPATTIKTSGAGRQTKKAQARCAPPSSMLESRQLGRKVDERPGAQQKQDLLRLADPGCGIHGMAETSWRCHSDLSTISTTGIGRDAHVKACLDMRPAGPSQAASACDPLPAGLSQSQGPWLQGPIEQASQSHRVYVPAGPATCASKAPLAAARLDAAATPATAAASACPGAEGTDALEAGGPSKGSGGGPPRGPSCVRGSGFTAAGAGRLSSCPPSRPPHPASLAVDEARAHRAGTCSSRPSGDHPGPSSVAAWVCQSEQGAGQEVCEDWAAGSERLGQGEVGQGLPEVSDQGGCWDGRAKDDHTGGDGWDSDQMGLVGGNDAEMGPGDGVEDAWLGSDDCVGHRDQPSADDGWMGLGDGKKDQDGGGKFVDELSVDDFGGGQDGEDSECGRSEGRAEAFEVVDLTADGGWDDEAPCSSSGPMAGAGGPRSGSLSAAGERRRRDGRERCEPAESTACVVVSDGHVKAAAAAGSLGPGQVRTPAGNSVESWLVSIGLSHHAPLFEASGINEEVLPHLTDGDLQELGVRLACDRVAMLRSIVRLSDSGTAPVASKAARSLSDSLGQTPRRLSPLSARVRSPQARRPAAPQGLSQRRLAKPSPSANAPPHPTLAGQAAGAPRAPPSRAAGGAHASSSEAAASPSASPPAPPPPAGCFSSLFSSRPLDLDKSRITSYFPASSSGALRSTSSSPGAVGQLPGPPPAGGQQQQRATVGAASAGAPSERTGNQDGPVQRGPWQQRPSSAAAQPGGWGGGRGRGSAMRPIGLRGRDRGGPAGGAGQGVGSGPRDVPKVAAAGAPGGSGGREEGTGRRDVARERAGAAQEEAGQPGASGVEAGAAAWQKSGGAAAGGVGSSSGCVGPLGSLFAADAKCGSSYRSGLLAAAAAAGPPQGTGLSRRVQRWHTIPGTRFLVDLFTPASRDIRGCSYWFLTHFHSDHYMGLTSKFRQGIIVCSLVTAQLINVKLKVPWSIIMALPFNEPFLVEGTTVMLVDANHCPGAAMIVAMPPSGVPVLHTGDARLVPEMQQHPALQKLVGKAILVLDTTYCNPQYTFPSQQDILKFTLGAVDTEKFNPRVLFLFGTYTIGKERLFFEVARSMGKQVYVSKEKMQILQCCNLAPLYAQMLTTNHLDTNLHAVPLFKINVQSMAEILQRSNGRYTAVVGFAPTGWSHQKEQRKGKLGRQQQRGSVIMHQVPYSEHSSYTELVDFVSWLKPLEILPSVGNDNGGPKAKRMIQLLLHPARNNQQTLDGVFTKIPRTNEAPKP